MQRNAAVQVHVSNFACSELMNASVEEMCAAPPAENVEDAWQPSYCQYEVCVRLIQSNILFHVLR